MRPLFMLDTKTQRGFMACLKFEDLEMAMREQTILLEIKLATLQHYFEIASYCSDVRISYATGCEGYDVLDPSVRHFIRLSVSQCVSQFCFFVVIATPLKPLNGIL